LFSPIHYTLVSMLTSVPTRSITFPLFRKGFINICNKGCFHEQRITFSSEMYPIKTVILNQKSQNYPWTNTCSEYYKPNETDNKPALKGHLLQLLILLRRGVLVFIVAHFSSISCQIWQIYCNTSGLELMFESLVMFIILGLFLILQIVRLL
jgi:hypothetical protein